MADVVARYDDQRDLLHWYCPGCGIMHHVPAAQWNWNKSLESPTLSPSVKRTTEEGQQDEWHFPATCCHFFIRDGEITFCGDCTHEMKGKKIIMVPLNEVPKLNSTIWPPRQKK